MQNLTYSAIQAALRYDWKKAIQLNEEILKEKADDIDALSRLGYAQIQLGKIERAKQLYRKILSIDRYNLIAQKNLDKLNSLPKNAKNSSQFEHPSPLLHPNLFIEEPGKTKTVVLTHTAPPSMLSSLNVGTTVFLYPKKHSIEVRTFNKTYLGALPDDLAFRLLRFIKAGNQYHICLKNVTKNSISVFIKETKRGKRFLSQPSFVTSVISDLHTLAKDIKFPHEEDESTAGNQDEFEE